MNIKIHNVFTIALSEYLEWIANTRNIILLVLLITLNELVISPLVNYAKAIGQPLNCFETNIAVTNSFLGSTLIIIVYLVLITSFPTFDDNTNFCIFRMGRRNWVIGEFVFQILAVVTYSGIIMAFAFLRSGSISFLENGWSLVVTENGKVVKGLIDLRLYNQMTPLACFMYSWSYTILFLLLSSVVYTFGCICGKRLLAFLIQVGIIVVGFLAEIAAVNIQWLFPNAHASLRTHMHRVLRAQVMPLQGSFIYFGLLIVLFSIWTYRVAKDISTDVIEVARK